MKAAVVIAASKPPVYADFREPVAADGMEVITVSASALSHLSKARASGAHYSSSGAYPAVAGVDGVGHTVDGRRVYFVLPEAPFGALAEKSLVRADQCVELTDSLDDVTAAALANPGMSAWAALVVRAQLQRGETVLVNGATGTAGRISVQLAKHLGAGKVIVTGRNAAELEDLKALGADVAIAFSLGANYPEGAKHFEEALQQELAGGIDIVIDYLWGTSALTIITAIAKAAPEAVPVRFVQVGSAGGDGTIALPAAALRSSSLELMGSGLGSVPMAGLLDAVRGTFAAAAPAGLKVAVAPVPLSEIESAWDEALGRPRVVFTM